MTAASAVARSWGRMPIAPAVAIVAGAVVGAATVAAPPVGAALAVAAVAVPVGLADVPVAVAIWAAIGPLQGLGFVGPAATLSGLLVGAAWLLRATRDRAAIRMALRRQRRLLLVLGLLLTWMTLSIAWARYTGKAAESVAFTLQIAAVLVVMLTSLRTPRDVTVVMAGLIVGTVLSVLVGLVAGGFAPTPGPTTTSVEGRLSGGAGDPNYLAAFIVPAAVLAIAIMPRTLGAARALLVLAFGVLVVGLMAAQSRGGWLAALAALVAAFVLLPRKRAWVLAAAVGIVCVALMYLAINPSALARVTPSETDGGSGRTDLWVVALRMTDEHPLTGVGAGNFELRAPDFVRRPGVLRYVRFEIEVPHVAHNAYLQTLSEIGVVGLALFAAFVAIVVRAALVAARRFERNGDHALGDLARALVIAYVGVLTASVFLSIGYDRIVWVLLGLGPAMLALAPVAPRSYRRIGPAGARPGGPQSAAPGVKITS